MKNKVTVEVWSEGGSLRNRISNADLVMWSSGTSGNSGRYVQVRKEGRLTILLPGAGEQVVIAEEAP